MDGKLNSKINPNTRAFHLYFPQEERRIALINTETSSKVKKPPLHQAHFPSFHSYATQVNDTLHANGGLLSYEQTPVPYLIVTAGVGMQMRIGSSSICKRRSQKTRIQYVNMA